jgi:hypothetical protein
MSAQRTLPTIENPRVTDQNVDVKYYEVIRVGGFAEGVMIAARDRMFVDFLRVSGVQPGQLIVDVGVSDVISASANVLERSYPDHADITACGIGSAPDFVTAFPDVRYVQIEPNRPLPFADKSFAIATANAVLEHVGSVANQQFFIAELCRVAQQVFVTVPNRFFPIEHHTSIPFAHYSDATFALACRLAGKRKWSETANLILMSAARLKALAPARYQATVRTTGVNLGPFSSNLYLHLRAAKA